MGLVNWTRIDAKIHDVSILKPQNVYICHHEKPLTLSDQI